MIQTALKNLLRFTRMCIPVLSHAEFLLCQTSQASATMCSSMLDNIVKHDSFSRMLQLGSYGSHYVWSKAKSLLKSLKKSFR